jgi:hypothetical protein
MMVRVKALGPFFEGRVDCTMIAKFCARMTCLIGGMILVEVSKYECWNGSMKAAVPTGWLDNYGT